MPSALKRRVEALERANEPPEESLAERIASIRRAAIPGQPRVWRESFDVCGDPLAERIRQARNRVIAQLRADGYQPMHLVRDQAQADALLARLPSGSGSENRHIIVIQST